MSSGKPFYLRPNKGKELQGNCLTLRLLLEEAPAAQGLRFWCLRHPTRHSMWPVSLVYCHFPRPD